MEEKTVRQKGEPLLYIHQPDFNKPEIIMQDYFYSTEKKVKEENEKIPKKEEKKIKQQQVPNFKKPHNTEINNRPVDDHASKEVVQEKTVKQEKKNDPPLSAASYFRRNSLAPAKKHWHLTPVKSFKEMSIQEKLKYLSGFPVSQPPYPCEFVTAKDQYRGTLLKYEGEQIFVKTFTEEVAEIKVDDLTAIKIIF
ncbi:CotO family spore coat protein [Lederbergia citrea]|uniref:Spore coat protein CotO n=1 Tax=Lederbergia citrea TaxID=2833581 RepID=A0A942ULY4_9BACI|nr:CotO family spore coat protein [Lederbergia citrea]MBS4177386.1 hypothetical protein [Lederbergia citrea]MBS4204064.1 hypothetical protein [Lederbergia citrea]MBS4221351.1 hypothetical protein [Lederbergia citrea]